MQEEYLVPIEGFDNYSISNFGRVVNTVLDRDLTPRPGKNGLLKVRLYLFGAYADFYIHELVAAAFFLNWEYGIEVEHISDDLTDNSVGNLRLKKVVD